MQLKIEVPKFFHKLKKKLYGKIEISNDKIKKRMKRDYKIVLRLLVQ